MTEEQKSIPEEKQSFRLFRSVWRWTGLDKKLWDYLQLLIVPIFLAVGAFILQDQANQRQQKSKEQTDQRQQSIADDRARQETLNKYFDEMTDLLFERELRAAKLESEARIVARARTLTALRELDGGRKGQLVRFLHEADLITQAKPVIYLSDADLRFANLSNADLSDADLFDADLFDANLSSASLRGANLWGANLYGAILQVAILSDGDLKDALFCKTKMPDGTENNQNCPQKQSP